MEQTNQRRSYLRKKNTHRTIVMRLMKLVGIVLMPMLLYWCWTHYYVKQMENAYLWRGNLAIAALYGLLIVLMVRAFRGYELGNLEWRDILISQVLAQFACNCIFYVLFFFLCERLVNPLPLLGLQCAEFIATFALVRVSDYLFWKMSDREKLAVLYRDGQDLLRIEQLDGFFKCFDVAEEIVVKDYTKELLSNLNDIDNVLIVGVDADTRNGILKDCVENGIVAHVLPKVGDIILRGAQVTLSSGEIILRANRPELSPEHLLFKRAFDIFASLLGIVLTSPIMLITAIAIKAQDGGPVFYRQVRLTKDRREFRIIKFRSMRVDAEKDGKARLASDNDDRITKVGHFIRACRIDELPQLFNILGGSMTIVGPRPERPEIAQQYEENMPSFALRLQVKAGLTGYAQIYGRYNSEPYEKLQMDLMYISHMSVTEDIKLMFGTIRILLKKESTTGVADGQLTAAHDSREEKN